MFEGRWYVYACRWVHMFSSSRFKSFVEAVALLMACQLIFRCIVSRLLYHPDASITRQIAVLALED